MGLLCSCSTQKNTKVSRLYHAFTTRYNIYYNGKTSFDEQLKAMQDQYQENYSEMIHIHSISAAPKDKESTGGAFDRAIEKSDKAIKLHSIQVKPEKKPGWRNNPRQVALQEKEEYNPFLKNSWMMLGEAQFYNADFLQAAATFSYISRHYSTEPETATEARIRQARCYTEMGWFYESEDILNKLNKEGFPKKNQNLYALVYADYLIKEGKFEEAVPYLQTAIKAEKNGHQRARMRYLLGQIYTGIGSNSLAYEAFGKVIKASPPYELEFAARIRQTEVFAGTDYRKVVGQLQRMAKSEKNVELLDQVYYALGNIYLNRQDTANAINNYNLGIEKSIRNGMDKAICQIKLGDIYFEQREYIKAQPCFSGALAAIQKEHKDYGRMSKLSSVLDELVIHAEAVHLQDSLQTIARMPEEERLSVIDKIIENIRKEEEAAKEQAEKEAYLAQQESIGGIDRPGTQTDVAMPVTMGDNSFYFYSQQLVTQGKMQFQRTWGRRTLEDNWRRKNKTVSTYLEDTYANSAETDSVAMATDDEGNLVPVDNNEAALAGLSDDPKSREYYIQQLPLTPEDIEASDIIIEDGLYNMALIYKDKLEDLTLSIEGFRELEKRFPGHSHRLESYYQVYLMALRLGNTVLAEEYKNKLTGTFPESDYAVAISDADYEYNIRMMDHVQDSLYQRTYDYYLNGNVIQVRKFYGLMGEKYPLSSLMPKFMFLNAMAFVEEGDVDGLKAALQQLIDKYPDADVSELAGEMLKGMLRGRELVQGNVRGMKWNLRFGVSGEGGLSAEDSTRVFVAETNTPYCMLLIYPTESFDANRLLFAVAAYNFSNFIVKEFDLEQETSGLVSTLKVKGFYNFGEIQQYYKMIYGEDGYASSLGREVIALPISENNYTTLMRGKTVEEYIDFFEEHYGELAPEMVSRWTAHHDADHEEEENTEAISGGEAPAATDTTLIQKEEENAAAGIPADSIAPGTLTTDSLQIQADSLPSVQPQEENTGLTLKEIEEIRKREAEEKAALEEAERIDKEERERVEQELKEQQAREREDRLRLQREEEADKLKTKAELDKQRERERKEKLKQAEAERKAKEKARREELIQKEKAYKERLRLQEKERKQKEKEYRAKLKQREAEQRAARRR